MGQNISLLRLYTLRNSLTWIVSRQVVLVLLSFTLIITIWCSVYSSNVKVHIHVRLFLQVFTDSVTVDLFWGQFTHFFTQPLQIFSVKSEHICFDFKLWRTWQFVLILKISPWLVDFLQICFDVKSPIKNGNKCAHSTQKKSVEVAWKNM